MRARSGLVASVLIVAVGGCSSSEPSESSPKPAAKPAPAPAASTAPAPAPSAEQPAGGIVIKGSKHADEPSRAKVDDEAEARRQAKIEELKRKAAEGNVTSDWIDFAPEEGKFRVLFPRKPEFREGPMRSPNGATFHMKLWAVETQQPDARAFVVGVAELPGVVPADKVDTILLAYVQGASRAGKVIEMKTVTLDGNPGRAILSEAGPKNTLSRSRIFLVGGRTLYALDAIAPKEEIDSRDVSRFFESFKLKP